MDATVSPAFELDALPAAALRPGDAVTRAMQTRGGRLIDARVAAFEPPRAERQPLVEDDPARLEAWMRLLARRRGQLAHDLSGPATGILAALETVLEYEPIPASSRGLLQEARAGMLLLTRRLESRDGLLTARVNALEGPLDELLRTWVDAAARALDPTLTRFDVEVVAPARGVRLDSALAQGALRTLLRNAWSFRCGQRAVARIGARSDLDGLQLWVEDEGRGLSDEALARAGELGFTTRASGIGLGLFTLRFALRDRGAVRLTRRAGGCRADVFLPANTT